VKKNFKNVKWDHNHGLGVKNMAQFLPENYPKVEIPEKGFLWDRKSGWTILILFVVLYFGLNLLAGLFQFESLNPFIFTLIALLVNLIACYGSVLIISVFIKKYTFTDLGFRQPEWIWIRRAIYWGIGLMFIRGLLAQGLLNLFPILNFGTEMLEQALVTNNPTVISQIVVIILGAILIPVGEELFFRGFLFRWMRNRMTFRVAILLSAFVFSAIHLIPIQAIMAFPLGVLNAWMFERSRSLIPVIVLHITNNGLALILSAVATLSQ
jgi:membrane protease YdiL (CAAX protease family)